VLIILWMKRVREDDAERGASESPEPYSLMRVQYVGLSFNFMGPSISVAARDAPYSGFIGDFPNDIWQHHILPRLSDDHAVERAALRLTCRRFYEWTPYFDHDRIVVTRYAKYRKSSVDARVTTVLCCSKEK
jgi:hypothetical protein